MTTATSNSVTFTVSSSVPSWASGISVNSWGAISSSVPNQVIPATDTGIWAEFSGGVLNTDGVYHAGSYHAGPHLIIFGGGRACASNEVMAFGPLTGTPTWRQLRAATSPPPDDADGGIVYATARDASGNPVSAHSYAQLAYVSSRRWLVRIGNRATYSSDGNLAGAKWDAVDRFDFTVTNPNSTQPWGNLADGGSGSYGNACAYSETDDCIWYTWRLGTLVGRFDCGTLAWSYGNVDSGHNTDGDESNGGQAVMSSDDTLFVRVSGSGDDRVFCKDIRTGWQSMAWFQVSATGGPTFSGGGRDSIAANSDGTFTVFCGSDRKLYKLTPSADKYQGSGWTWGSGSTAAPVASANAGLYGRFQRVDTGGFAGYIYSASGSDSVYFYRTA